MTKADLVEQVADAIGPPVTKKACKESDRGVSRLGAGRARAGRRDRTQGIRHLQGAASQGPHGPEPENRRTRVEVPPRRVPVFQPSSLFRARVDQGVAGGPAEEGGKA